jgi:hypothetical protein
MKCLRTASTVFGVAPMAAAMSPSLKADDWNRKTVITLSGRVEIPGVHLTGFGALIGSIDLGSLSVAGFLYRRNTSSS